MKKKSKIIVCDTHSYRKSIILWNIPLSQEIKINEIEKCLKEKSLVFIWNYDAIQELCKLLTSEPELLSNIHLVVPISCKLEDNGKRYKKLFWQYYQKEIFTILLSSSKLHKWNNIFNDPYIYKNLFQSLNNILINI